MSKIKFIFLLLVCIVCITMLVIGKKDNIITVDEVNNDNSNTKIVLYFTNENTNELKKEYRFVSLNEIKDNISKVIINELLKGPSSEELISMIPNSTKLNKITQEKDKIIVDFSNEFIAENEEEFNKLHKIYSIVNSLTEITEINEVEILVNGENYTKKERL